eukprot:scaffold1663_cov171-Amphora_coffeaeformis.AAC.18
MLWIGVPASIRRSLTVSFGKPSDDDDHSVSSHNNDDDDEDHDKYHHKGYRTRVMAKKRTKGLVMILFLVVFFWIRRYVAVRRDDREMLYARARAFLQERNAKHKAQSHQDDPQNDEVWSLKLEKIFQTTRLQQPVENMYILLKDWMHQVNLEIRGNLHGGIRWVRPYMLPSGKDQDKNEEHVPQDPSFYQIVQRKSERMSWQAEYDSLMDQHKGGLPGPPVEYTNPDKYQYPPLMEEPPTTGGYPKMLPLGDLMHAWDQDTDNKGVITETLLHFDFSDPKEMVVAKKFRDAMLPFKIYNVPELARATNLWTDEYVAQGMEERNLGMCQESPNNFFTFFGLPKWNEISMGLPPTNYNDFKYQKWSQHAIYADSKSLGADRPHFYWQVGVKAEERHQPKELWSFISRDLPSFSSNETNFITFNPDEQKGIQCRFGERGVVAATHYDGGRNMVGMITGAKRYILSPPKACGKLGIFPGGTVSPLVRHSPLNFGHFKYLNNPNLNGGMSQEERTWLERASAAPAVETVLKAGEILYIPSFWFHYIVSLQKSAQCNVRSGEDEEPHAEFGGYRDVTQMCHPDDI